MLGVSLRYDYEFMAENRLAGPHLHADSDQEVLAGTSARACELAAHRASGWSAASCFRQALHGRSVSRLTLPDARVQVLGTCSV